MIVSISYDLVGLVRFVRSSNSLDLACILLNLLHSDTTFSEKLVLSICSDRTIHFSHLYRGTSHCIGLFEG